MYQFHIFHYTQFEYVIRLSSELSSCRKDLLEKLTVTQLVKKFPTFYGTRRFITVFTGPI
jgi:hypothetical protein